MDSSQSLGARVPIPRERREGKLSYGLPPVGVGEKDGEKTKGNWKGKMESSLSHSHSCSFDHSLASSPMHCIFLHPLASLFPRACRSRRVATQP